MKSGNEGREGERERRRNKEGERLSGDGKRNVKAVVIRMREKE